MVVFSGGHASGFRNVREHDTYDPNKPKLFHVQGTCEDDTRAMEVTPEAKSLDSDDCFVLDAPGVTYIWVGKVTLMRKTLHQYHYHCGKAWFSWFFRKHPKMRKTWQKG